MFWSATTGVDTSEALITATQVSSLTLNCILCSPVNFLIKYYQLKTPIKLVPAWPTETIINNIYQAAVAAAPPNNSAKPHAGSKKRKQIGLGNVVVT
jgi:hypothetical protein